LPHTVNPRKLFSFFKSQFTPLWEIVSKQSLLKKSCFQRGPRASPSGKRTTFTNYLQKTVYGFPYGTGSIAVAGGGTICPNSTRHWSLVGENPPSSQSPNTACPSLRGDVLLRGATRFGERPNTRGLLHLDPIPCYDFEFLRSFATIRLLPKLIYFSNSVSVRERYSAVFWLKCNPVDL
jgi:hypothetical protein